MKKTVIASLAAVGLFSGASAYTVSFLNVASADPTAEVIEKPLTPIKVLGNEIAPTAEVKERPLTSTS